MSDDPGNAGLKPNRLFLTSSLYDWFFLRNTFSPFWAGILVFLLLVLLPFTIACHTLTIAHKNTYSTWILGDHINKLSLSVFGLRKIAYRFNMVACLYIFLCTARQSTHQFPSEEEEKKALIYQYNPLDTSKESTFQQCYFF